MLILTRERSTCTFYLRTRLADVTEQEYVISTQVLHRNPPSGTVYDVVLPDGSIRPLDEVMMEHQTVDRVE